MTDYELAIRIVVLGSISYMVIRWFGQPWDAVRTRVLPLRRCDGTFCFGTWYVYHSAARRGYTASVQL